MGPVPVYGFEQALSGCATDFVEIHIHRRQRDARVRRHYLPIVEPLELTGLAGHQPVTRGRAVRQSAPTRVR